MALLIETEDLKHIDSILAKWVDVEGVQTLVPIGSCLVIVNSDMNAQTPAKIPIGTQEKTDEEGNVLINKKTNSPIIEFIYKDVVQVNCTLKVYEDDTTKQDNENAMNVSGIPFKTPLYFDPKDPDIIANPNDLNVIHSKLEEHLIDMLTGEGVHPEWKGKIKQISNPNPIS